MFTPEVEDVFRWFRLTHEMADGQWRRVAYPAPGGAGEQDALLMEHLGVLRQAMNRVDGEQRAKRDPREEFEQFRLEKGRG